MRPLRTQLPGCTMRWEVMLKTCMWLSYVPAYAFHPLSPPRRELVGGHSRQRKHEARIVQTTHYTTALDASHTRTCTRHYHTTKLAMENKIIWLRYSSSLFCAYVRAFDNTCAQKRLLNHFVIFSCTHAHAHNVQDYSLFL